MGEWFSRSEFGRYMMQSSAEESLVSVLHGMLRPLQPLYAMTGFLRPYLARYAIAVAALAIAAGSMLLLANATKNLIDGGFRTGNSSSLRFALLTVAVIGGIHVVSAFVRYYLFTWIGERVVADVREKVFEHVLGLSPSFFDHARTGDVLSRLMNDTQRLEVVFARTFNVILRNSILMIGSIVMITITSAQFTLIIVAAGAFIIGTILAVGRQERNFSELKQDRVADTSGYADEALHAVRVIQAYTHERRSQEGFQERNERVFAAGVRAGAYGATMLASVVAAAVAAIVLILLAGGNAVLAGKMSPGDLSSTVVYAALLATSSTAIAESYGELQAAVGPLERLLALMATKSEIRVEVPAAVSQPIACVSCGQGSSRRALIQYDSVTFHYPSRPHRAVLTDFRLEVMAGQAVVLLGPSGAGKSTVLQLLLRFYDPQQGGVKLDGSDLRSVDPKEIRRQISFVTQDPVVFADSILENVRYGRRDASREEVWNALCAAHCAEFVDELSDGIDTVLGERGAQLSGGQRQRLALARAFLAARPILLLDEPTSALDGESEQMVQQAMVRLQRDRTVIIIAHHWATMEAADHIVVLDHRGRVVAEGTHRDMVGQRIYADHMRGQLHGGDQKLNLSGVT